MRPMDNHEPGKTKFGYEVNIHIYNIFLWGILFKYQHLYEFCSSRAILERRFIWDVWSILDVPLKNFAMT